MNQQRINEYPLTLQRPSDEHLHAGSATTGGGSGYPGSYTTACGLNLAPGPVTEVIKHPTCPACVLALYGIEDGQLACMQAEVDRLKALANFDSIAAEAPVLMAFWLLNGHVHDTKSRDGQPAKPHVIHARNVLRWETIDGNPPAEVSKR